eukprot:scaffold581_cov127-Skeletonema_marinoi.AAC.26
MLEAVQRYHTAAKERQSWPRDWGVEPLSIVYEVMLIGSEVVIPVRGCIAKKFIHSSHKEH